jgi:hypothetical protein
MNDKNIPFLVRDQLSFGDAQQIQLSITYISTHTGVWSLTGFTRAGIFTYKFTATASDTAQNVKFALNDIPISLSLTPAVLSGAACLGFAQIDLMISGDKMQTLNSGTLSSSYPLCWPISITNNDFQEKGVYERMAAIDPATGANIVYTIPAKQQWEIFGVTLRLDASSTVADRTVKLKMGYAAEHQIYAIAGTTQQASEAQQYYFVPNGTTREIIANTTQEVTLPQNIILMGGDSIETFITNLQANDEIHSMIISVRRTFFY